MASMDYLYFISSPWGIPICYSPKKSTVEALRKFFGTFLVGFYLENKYFFTWKQGIYEFVSIIHINYWRPNIIICDVKIVVAHSHFLNNITNLQVAFRASWCCKVEHCRSCYNNRQPVWYEGMINVVFFCHVTLPLLRWERCGKLLKMLIMVGQQVQIQSLWLWKFKKQGRLFMTTLKWFFFDFDISLFILTYHPKYQTFPSAFPFTAQTHLLFHETRQSVWQSMAQMYSRISKPDTCKYGREMHLTPGLYVVRVFNWTPQVFCSDLK